MNQIRIKSTPLFKQVAAVIGEERAQIELAIAYHGYNSRGGFEFCDPLNIAFTWRRTPQGRSFWQSIHDGVNPCKD